MGLYVNVICVCTARGTQGYDIITGRKKCLIILAMLYPSEPVSRNWVTSQQTQNAILEFDKTIWVNNVETR